MRDFLTGIAIIVILALTIVLVAPYVVDWNGQRGFLEARLSAALGQKVTIGGHIDLKVLPTPYLVLDQVVVGSDDGAVRIGIHHVDLELSVAPLLHGAFDIVEARLEEPTIRIGLLPDRTLPALPSAPAFQADVHFDRIQVSDGTLAVSDPTSGRTFTFDHIDLDADAGSFLGPFKVAGAGGPPERRTRFRLSTAAPDKGRARTRLIVEETSAHPALEFDGTVGLGSTGDAAPQMFEGRTVLSGHVAGLADEPPSWSLSGPARAGPHGASLDDGELRLGGEEAGLTLQATLKAGFDDAPALAMSLSAKQIDIDRLAGAPVDAVKPPPPKLPDLATLRQAFAALAPPLPTIVDLTIDDATYGGEALSGIKAHFGLGAGTPQPLAFAATGPAGTRLSVDGTLSPKTSAPFKGTIDVEAENLGRAVSWLGSIAPGFPWRATDVPFSSLHVKGDLHAGADRIDSDRLTITLDRSILAGPAHVALGRDDVPPRLATHLSAETLDLDGLPAFDAARATLTGLDLDLALDATSLKIANFGTGSLATGPLALAVTKAGRRIDLVGLRVRDVGGADLAATGRLDVGDTTLAIDLDAEKLEVVAGLAQQLVPSAAADALAARAASLAPAKLKIASTIGATAGASSFTVAGMLGATRVDVTWRPNTGAGDPVAFSGSLTAADGGALLRQLVAGGSAAGESAAGETAAGKLGPGALRFAALGTGTSTGTGTGTAPLDASLSVMLGTTTMDLKGHVEALAWPLAGEGTARLHGTSIAPVLDAMRLASNSGEPLSIDLSAEVSVADGVANLRDIAGQIGQVATTGTLAYRTSPGDGPALTGSLKADRISLASLAALILGPRGSSDADAWSRDPFRGGLREPPRAAIAFKADRLDIWSRIAQEASFDLAVEPNVLRLDHGTARLAGGTLGGRATIRRDGPMATVEGTISLVGQAIDADPVTARIDASLDFAGGGPSPAAIVANLAGSGSATASRLMVRQADPGALSHVFKDVESDAIAVDQDTIARAFDEAAKAPLDLGSRTFSLGLASGVLRFVPSDPPAPAESPTAARIEGTYDLGRTRVAARVEETLLALPKNWSGPPPSIAIALAGSPDRLSRTLDVGSFLNAVAARALARETARIEAYELDIRERSFFNARLQADKRREEDRQKVEADRKAKIEAARLERARQDDAARDRTDTPNKPAQAPKPAQAKPPATGDPSAMGRY